MPGMSESVIFRNIGCFDMHRISHQRHRVMSKHLHIYTTSIKLDTVMMSHKNTLSGCQAQLHH